jgi:hypothetical protein
LFKPQAIDSVPTRKQDGAVLAIAAPPIRIELSRSAERLAVIAADYEKGIHVVGRKFLDALPGSHERLEWGLVAIVVILLQIGERPANSGGCGGGHVYTLPVVDCFALLDVRMSRCANFDGFTLVSESASAPVHDLGLYSISCALFSVDGLNVTTDKQ